MVFENEGFWFYEAPDGSFGLILALLGHSDPKMGSKMSFNLFRKSGKKTCVKHVLKKVQKWMGKLGAQIFQNPDRRLRHFLPRHAFFNFFCQIFAWRFGGSWVSLGRLLGLLRVSWEVSGPKNTKNPMVF